MVLNKRNKSEHLTDRWLLECYSSSKDLFYLGQLFSRYVHLVYGVCLKWTEDRELAQDASIGVLEGIIKWIDKIGDVEFRYWLFNLTNNYCELFMKEKDSIGFLKERIGDESTALFSGEQPVNYSVKLIWTNYSKGKLDLSIDFNEEVTDVLNKFYLNDFSTDDIALLIGTEVELVRNIIRDNVKNILQSLDGVQKSKMKPNLDKSKYEQWENYLQYFTNELHGKERNAFEREFLSDPFEYSAIEGMSPYAGVSIEADHDILYRRIHRRTGYEKDVKRDFSQARSFISYIGGSIVVVIMIVFIVIKLSVKKGTEEIPRRVIESTIEKEKNGLGQVFESEKADSLDREGEISIKTPAEAVMKRQKEFMKQKLDTITPIAALSLKQINLEQESNSSVVFVDLHSSNRMKFEEQDVSLVRFEPEGGMKSYKKELIEQLIKKGLYQEEGVKINYYLNSNGDVINVKIIGVDDADRVLKITDIVKIGPSWNLIRGNVAKDREYHQQIEL